MQNSASEKLPNWRSFWLRFLRPSVHTPCDVEFSAHSFCLQIVLFPFRFPVKKETMSLIMYPVPKIKSCITSGLVPVSGPIVREEKYTCNNLPERGLPSWSSLGKLSMGNLNNYWLQHFYGQKLYIIQWMRMIVTAVLKVCWKGAFFSVVLVSFLKFSTFLVSLEMNVLCRDQGQQWGFGNYNKIHITQQG